MMGVQLCKKPRIFAARRSTVAATGRSHRNQQKQRGVAPRTCWWHFTWWPLRWKKLPKNGEDSNGFFWCSKIWFKPGRWFQPPTSFLRRSHGSCNVSFFLPAKLTSTFNLSGWWFFKYCFYVHLENWGKMNPFWRRYSFKGVGSTTN